MQFLGFSNHEKGALKANFEVIMWLNHLFHYPPEACDKWSAEHFQEVDGAL
jgi:hypothetical protein